MELSQLNELLHDGPLPDLVGAVSRSADRATLLQLLDAELKRREERFRLIQEYRNLFGAPVHALPPEVLARIFFFYALDKDYKTLLELRWTRLLLVCRRWRNVACSTPLLWSFVSLEPLPVYPLGYDPESLISRVALQRERVGDYPMRVRMRVAELPTDVTFFRPYQPFYWKPSSLASLRLTGSGNKMESFFSTMVDHEYPILTNLDVENDISDARPLLFIPDNFLLRLSSLRHLRIAGVHLNFQLLHGLRSLYIHYSAQPVMFEIDEILGALSQCPHLESLRIDLQRGVLASTNQLPQINLPDLLDLGLDGPLATCAQILSCLRLPGTCKISFAATNEVDTLALQPLLLYLQAHCCLPDAPSIASLALNADEHAQRRIDISFCTNEQPRPPHWTRSVPQRAFDPHIVHILLPASTDERCNEYVTAIISTFPVHHATLLDIRHMSSVHHEVLLSLIHRLPALSTIACSLGRASLDGLLHALLLHLGQAEVTTARILLDAEHVSRWKVMYSRQTGMDSLQSQTTDLETAYAQFKRIIQYCAAAQVTGKPVDVLEVVNDGDPSVLDRSPSYSLADIHSRTLWRHLGIGFVYNGVLRNNAIVLAELQEARRRTIASGDVWDPEESYPDLVFELDDPVALVGLVD